MENNFVFYVHSEILDSKNFIDDKIDGFIKLVNPILNVGRKLKAKIYYSITDIRELEEWITEPDFNKDFSKSQANKLALLLDDLIPNKEINHFFKVHFSEDQTSLEPVKMPFINSKFIDQKHVIFTISENSISNNLLFVKSNKEFEKIEVTCFSNAQSIWEFINKNLPPRKYNFSSKHGNKDKKAIPPRPSEKVSQLKCTDDQAQLLLDSAIFDLRENIWCYNFDKTHNTFIVFPCEGSNPQNQYHAFHIEENEWHKEIPKSILNHFHK